MIGGMICIEYKFDLIIAVIPTVVFNEYGVRTYIGNQKEHTQGID